ncbi:hypothetical protein JCM5350_002818 [Sporobolomyces pararoseus]
MLSFSSAVVGASLVTSVFAGAIISDPKNPPHQSENGQYGYNDCSKYGDSPNSNCQTAWINGVDDFCLWSPPSKATIGDSERYEVAWCTKAGHGTRLIPEGTLTGVHFTWAEKYVQITGTGKFTKMNIPAGDDGGELDPHGADGNGNPIGGLLLSNIGGKTFQFKEWTQFISDDEFCIRACYDGPDSWKWCIYDVMGCYWNIPGNYDSGSFDQCNAALPAQAMGEYKLKNGATSTWHQGVNPTPAGQNPPASWSCSATPTISPARYGGATTTSKPKTTTTSKPKTTTKKTTTKKTSTKKATTTTHRAKRSHA